MDVPICPHCHQVDLPALLRQTTQPRPLEQTTALAVSLEQAAEMIGVSMTTLKGYIRDGKLATVRIDERGGRRLVMVDDLRSLLLTHRIGGQECHDDELPPRQTRGRQLRPVTGGRQ